jgi:hypothetical protein
MTATGAYDVDQGFRDAWMECIEKHEGTLVSGPCDDCCSKYAAKVRAAHSRDSSAPGGTR